MANPQSLSSLSFLLFLLSYSAISTTAELCHPDDKRTLLSIKKSFKNAVKLASWSPKTDCCRDWFFVRCDDQTHRIIALRITNIGVSGPIPDAVGELPQLLAIFLINLPKLTGPIPKAITRLSNLNTLWISNTSISGPIPDFLGPLTNLTYIDLSHNNLNGPIPPSLSNIYKLGTLYLDQNRLTGQIPASFGRFKPDGDFYMSLAGNSLSGPIPRSLGAVNFTALDLSANYKLTGDASFLFEDNKRLQTLNLSRNQLTFDMTNLGLPKSLDVLDLSHNMVYGSLPKGLAKLPELQQFNVSYNRLCGRIPTGGKLNLFDQYSYVRNKCLCGSPLPPCKE